MDLQNPLTDVYTARADSAAWRLLQALSEAPADAHARFTIIAAHLAVEMREAVRDLGLEELSLSQMIPVEVRHEDGRDEIRYFDIRLLSAGLVKGYWVGLDELFIVQPGKTGRAALWEGSYADAVEAGLIEDRSELVKLAGATSIRMPVGGDESYSHGTVLGAIVAQWRVM